MEGARAMKDMGFTDAFIRVATDCPANAGVVPVAGGDRKPIHVLQYELLSAHPYRYTHGDLLFEVHVRHKAIPPDERRRDERAIRSELLARPHPCLRASLLPKKYGWGVHYDGLGRIALYPVESEEYRRFSRPDSGLTLFYAMRSKRA
jgi:hypothetical protein